LKYEDRQIGMVGSLRLMVA